MMMQIKFREATKNDIRALIKMLADDQLGKLREDVSEPLNKRYLKAFCNIKKDNNNELIVVENDQNNVIGMMQLTFIPYLTHIGSVRCLIEGVRIASDLRNSGIGKEMIRWAIQRADERQCSMVQLTTDKQRPEAISFYEKLGFQATHEGMKLKLR